MNRERLGVNQTFDVPVMQGTINPNQRNVTKRMVFIDSSQKQSLELNTDFTLNLSEPLTNVIEMRLHSVHIPNTWYTFDTHLGNTYYGVYFEYNGNEQIEKCLSIPSGNYTLSDIAETLQTQINALLGNNKQELTVTYSYKTNKLTFTTTSKLSLTMVFYSPVGIRDCSQNGCKAAYRNQNLGWTLGFRETNPPDSDFSVTIPTESIVTAPAPVDTYGPKTFFLIVDDYNHNRVNNGVVSMTDRSTKLSVPNYVPATQGDISCVEIDSPHVAGGSVQFAGRLVKTYPRRLTQAQIYTANEILANRNTPDFRIPPVSGDNVLAVIPLIGVSRLPSSEYEESNPQMTPFIASGTDLKANIRSYFGPVDIERMRVKLIDDKGNTVNLNGMDWSFSLCIEELYQY